jgi:hypothetical protein
MIMPLIHAPKRAVQSPSHHTSTCHSELFTRTFNLPQVRSLIQQCGKDFGGGLIRKTGFAQMLQHLIPLTVWQGP